MVPRYFYINFQLLTTVIFCYVVSLNCYPDQGRWLETFNENLSIKAFPKIMYNDTTVYVHIKCTSKDPISIRVGWLLRDSPCPEEFAFLIQEHVQQYYKRPNLNNFTQIYTTFNYDSAAETYSCKNNELHIKGSSTFVTVDKAAVSTMSRNNKTQTDMVVKTWQDSAYLFILNIECDAKVPKEKCHFEVEATVWMKNDNGYISAIEWPLLVFYGVMSLVYLVFGIFWMILSACYWKDLLRVQFWIGAVILMGMLEKACFYAEYQSINSTGMSIRGSVLFAEFISCCKRSLARLLVMIVCVGYGIVKPRLGPALRKVVIIGVVYLIFALVEGFIRVQHPRFENKTTSLTMIPLVVVDSIVLWWIFSNLIQTLRQMRLRRNTVKFNLYRHFSNILILVTIASVIFMCWSIYNFKMYNCIKNWQEWWVDEAFWHILFSVILLVIIWLWRPSNNNQRYAYSPMLDAEDMDDEDILMDNMTTGDMKNVNSDKKAKKVKERKPSAEDDLKWIDENIPASVVEQVYPLDSDEEINTAKITMSKMN